MTTKRAKRTRVLKARVLKARVLQDHFSQAINAVSRAVPKRSSLPILTSLLLESDGGRLKVIATNLQTRMTAWVGAQVEMGGAVVAPAAALKKLVALMPNEALSLAATIGAVDTVKKTSEPSTLEIASGKRTVVLDGHNRDDYPAIPAFGDDRFSIDPDALALALDRTLFATCDRDGRPVLYGVKFTTMGHTLRMTACDGFRLSVVEMPIILRPGVKPKACHIDVIVPADVLAHVRRVLPRKASETRHDVALALLADEGATVKELRFATRAYDVDGQIIEGVYPDTENILPHPTIIKTFDVAALTSEVAAAVEVVKDTNDRVEFHIGRHAIQVCSKAEGIGTFQGAVDVTGEGETRIAMNGKFVLEALKAMNSEFATIGLEAEGKPAMFRPEPGGGFYHIIMPMFVSESDWGGQKGQ